MLISISTMNLTIKNNRKVRDNPIAATVVRRTNNNNIDYLTHFVRKLIISGIDAGAKSSYIIIGK